MAIVNPTIVELCEKVDCRYTLVVETSKRARQLVGGAQPLIDAKGEICEWRDFSRFVVNQDTGGAIRGPSRADIFWGSDDYAKIAAGHLQHMGALYFLAPVR